MSESTLSLSLQSNSGDHNQHLRGFESPSSPGFSRILINTKNEIKTLDEEIYNKLSELKKLENLLNQEERVQFDLMTQLNS